MPLYEPMDESLSEIRLIKIEPPETDDDYEILRCTMIRGSLQEFGTKYLAISYVWGFEVALKPLMLNGHEVRITSNLSDFLLRYRKMNKVVSNWIFGNMFLWVDALCSYPGRHRTKYRRNLRFKPLFCEGVGFTYLECRARKGSNYFASQLRSQL